MKRLLALFGTLLLGALVALVVLGVRLEDRGGELRRTRAAHRQDAASLQAMRERLATTERLTRAFDRKRDRLRQTLRSSKFYALAYRKELNDVLSYLGSQGLSVTDSMCRGSDIGSVRPALLRPSQGDVVARPVLVQVMVVEPLLCDATVFVTVDGILYRSKGSARASRPDSARNPRRMKAMPHFSLRQARFVCFGIGSDYMEFDLPPGPHTLRLNGGCPQGTDLPTTIETEVDFVVH